MWCKRIVHNEGRGSKPRAVCWTGWGFGVLGLLASATQLVAQPTPAGTRIAFSAQLTYQTATGQVISITSDPAVMVVGQVAGVDLDPPGVSAADPGSTVLFSHTLRNVGNGIDSFTVVGRSQSGWPVRVFHDRNANGLVDIGDPILSGPIAIEAGLAVRLLLATDVPLQPALRGTTDTIRVVAASVFDPTVGDALIDQTQIRGAGISVALSKSVDRTSATVGEILTYTVRYSAEGTSRATNFRLIDPIPQGATYVPGTLRLNGAIVSDGVDNDAGAFDAVNNRIVVVLAAIAGGESGAITFQVRVGR